MVGWVVLFVCLFVCWLVGWLVSWLVGWWVGGLVGGGWWDKGWIFPAPTPHKTVVLFLACVFI